MAHQASASKVFRTRLREYLDSDDAPSKREFARLAGIHFTHLHKILAGSCDPGLDVAESIARAMGATLAEVLGENSPISA